MPQTHSSGYLACVTTHETGWPGSSHKRVRCAYAQDSDTAFYVGRPYFGQHRHIPVGRPLGCIDHSDLAGPYVNRCDWPNTLAYPDDHYVQDLCHFNTVNRPDIYCEPFCGDDLSCCRAGNRRALVRFSSADASYVRSDSGYARATTCGNDIAAETAVPPYCGTPSYTSGQQLHKHEVMTTSEYGTQ